MLVTSEAEACLRPVSFDPDVEALIYHVLIYLLPSVELSELDATGVSLQNPEYEALYGELSSSEDWFELFLEDVYTVWSKLDVVLDRL